MSPLATPFNGRQNGCEGRRPRRRVGHPPWKRFPRWKSGRRAGESSGWPGEKLVALLPVRERVRSLARSEHGEGRRRLMGKCPRYRWSFPSELFRGSALASADSVRVGRLCDALLLRPMRRSSDGHRHAGSGPGRHAAWQFTMLPWLRVEWSLLWTATHSSSPCRTSPPAGGGAELIGLKCQRKKSRGALMRLLEAKRAAMRCCGLCSSARAWLRNWCARRPNGTPRSWRRCGEVMEPPRLSLWPLIAGRAPG